MTNDLISRESLLAEFQHSDLFNVTEKHLSIIKNAPAVDAVEVVHAEWITARTLRHDGEPYCSACDCEAENEKRTPYCPNCGAKMLKRRESEVT